jgi:hypothetical protein
MPTISPVKGKSKRDEVEIESGEIVTSNDITPCKVEVKQTESHVDSQMAGEPVVNPAPFLV